MVLRTYPNNGTCKADNASKTNRIILGLSVALGGALDFTSGRTAHVKGKRDASFKKSRLENANFDRMV